MTAEREPIFNAPWPVLALVAAIVGGYALQGLAPQDWLFARYGFSPAGFAAGERVGLVSALFLHGSWGHALLNAAGLLAFGSPVARLFGPRAGGVLAFFLFYLVCGAFSSWTYALLHPGEAVVLVGASGAVSGLMGAVSRLLAGRGQLGPFFSRTVIGMAAAWLIVNLIVGLLGYAPGVGETPVAWEAHLTGYAAGLLLIGPAARILRRA
ncbi:MAG: rhomboid family intramembrane serine protease [Phenylobacterium sp.]|uniref:rhomboid family intramembrane serine protease n=1 Tax=Phenylobacterium sp. TaxID=1871053 RepID=UPI0039198DC9